jgi:uncharacterized small protein (DUF1192 family)
MIEDEAKPRPRRGAFEPALLEGWSVEELNHYIAALQAEIKRAEAEIGQRDAQRQAAEAFFRKP